MSSRASTVFGGWIIAILVVGGIIGFVVLLTRAAHGHDHARPELDGWFMGLRSKGAAPCCDGSEALRLDDVDWDVQAGHYRVRLQGVWVDVPDHAVVEGPNRAGSTMVWPFYQDGALRGIRCFMPGSMT